MFEVLKGAPLNTLKLFSVKCFCCFVFLTFIRNAFMPIQDLFHKNMHILEIKEIFHRKVFELQHLSKVFPNVGGNALFWRGH